MDTSAPRMELEHRTRTGPPRSQESQCASLWWYIRMPRGVIGVSYFNSFRLEVILPPRRDMALFQDGNNGAVDVGGAGGVRVTAKVVLEVPILRGKHVPAPPPARIEAARPLVAQRPVGDQGLHARLGELKVVVRVGRAPQEPRRGLPLAAPVAVDDSDQDHAEEAEHRPRSWSQLVARGTKLPNDDGSRGRG